MNIQIKYEFVKNKDLTKAAVSMLFSETNPYIRYARHLDLDKNSDFSEVIALDARLFYALDGYGKITVKNKVYEMQPFSLIVINSGVPYKISAPKNHIRYVAINFDFTQNANSYTAPILPVLKGEFKEEMIVDLNVFDDAKELSEVLYIKEIPVIQKKLSTIVNEYMQKLLYYENKSGHILAQCLADSMRFLQFGSSDPAKENANHIMAYIHKNFRENLTNHTLGNLFGYHPNYVSFLIKHLTDMPVHKYLIHVRLMNAANLLENTSLSCDEIAEKCGFCDLAHFSKYFKNHFGTSPSKYRNV